jgi:acetyl-CoA C-acetyltransferase
MIYFYDGLRIPTGKKGGIYKNIIPEKFASFLIDRLLSENIISSQEISEVIIANSIGLGGNMARYAMLLSILDKSTPATTIDMQCVGGLKAIHLAFNALHTSSSKLILCGGMESNSLRPNKNYHHKDPRYKENIKNVEVAIFDEKQESENALLEAALNVANKFKLDKTEMHKWVLDSHKKLEYAYQIPEFQEFISPYLDNVTDQTFKKNLSLESLQNISSESLIDYTTSTHFHDGAALVLLGRATSHQDFQKKSSIIIKAVSCVGGDPRYSPEGPIWAIEKLLKDENLNIDDVDLFEINESFAVKPLAVMKYFRIDSQKVNIFGGNLALGHPYAASGVINFLNLVAALKHSNKKRGIVAAGAAGGLGIAILVENLV